MDDANADKLPEVGKEYKHYDDGKISDTREYTVVVTDIVKFEDAPKEIVEKWKSELNNGYHTPLYDETDYFVFAKNLVNEEKYVYARAFKGGCICEDGWHTFDYYGQVCWNGFLDVTNTLLDRLYSGNL